MSHMYYRRKVSLALIQRFGSLSQLKFQKLLFLLSMRQDKPAYDFVPYKYGCFSFQSLADKRALIFYGYLKADEKRWVLTKTEDFQSQLTSTDQAALEKLYRDFGKYNESDLIQYTYTEYPYYAINSEIKDKYLNVLSATLVENAVPKQTGHALMTIGYEGLNLDAYLNRLIQNNVHALVDVRRNAKSMKYGFSKNQLQSAVEKLGIAYIHLPDFGIQSSERKNLNTDKAYANLFKSYRNTLRDTDADSFAQFREALNKYGRIALTCFEADAHHCHRSHLATHLSQSYLTELSPVHI